jgi:ABC-type microcin C transport system duplicated ATPase subunit YejF
VVRAGHIVEQGSGQTALQQPQRDYTRSLLAPVP